MRLTMALLKHVPLIKFVGGPHVFKTKAHPLGNGALPAGAAAAATSHYNPSPVEPKDGEFFSRSELPSRFQYKAPKENEIEDIISGGAELVW